MKKKRALRILSLILLCALTFTACKKNVGTPEDNAASKDENTGEKDKDEQESWKIGFSGIDMENPYFLTLESAIKEELDTKTDAWGINVSALELKDIVIPEDLKRTISKEAEAERERRAVIIKAEGDRMAAENLAAAAETLARTPGALHLRTLQSINDLSSDQSNTTIWMVPVEVLEAAKGFAQMVRDRENK